MGQEELRQELQIMWGRISTNQNQEKKKSVECKEYRKRRGHSKKNRIETNFRNISGQ